MSVVKERKFAVFAPLNETEIAIVGGLGSGKLMGVVLFDTKTETATLVRENVRHCYRTLASIQVRQNTIVALCNTETKSDDWGLTQIWKDKTGVKATTLFKLPK